AASLSTWPLTGSRCFSSCPLADIRCPLAGYPAGCFRPSVAGDGESRIMTAQARPLRARIGDSALAARLRRELQGEVLFDAFNRGRYATDASIYQVEPIGVVIPRTEQDLRVAVQIAAEEGVPLLPRGGGTSQCGQTVNTALVLDCTKF